MPGDVAGQGLADLAADLVDARRVDQDEPGPLQAVAVGRRLLPALGGPGDGRAVRRARLEDLLPEQGVEHRGFAPADHAEGGDLDRVLVELLAEVAELAELVGQGALLLGGELEPLERLLEALAGPGDQLLLLVELHEYLSERRVDAVGRLRGRHRFSHSSVVVGPGSRPRTRGPRRRARPRGRPPDQLDGQGEALGGEAHRERDRGEPEEAPGGVEDGVPRRLRAGRRADRRRESPGRRSCRKASWTRCASEARRSWHRT